jgi:hypothetical protein
VGFSNSIISQSGGDMFYDFNKLLSYNALLNFVIGERGVGKSFGAKKFVITDYLKNGNEFVYIRRYKTELDNAYEGFFDQLQNEDLFLDHQFRITSSKKKIDKFYIDKEVFGYGIPLSTANILKSASFPKVKTLIFDEFLIDNGTYHYLRNEVIQFLDVIETIARLRDVRVILLGNAITISNPYFDFFKLTLPYNSEFKTFKNGTIVVNYIKNQAYRDKKKATRFGQLIDGTEYGEYAIDNAFLRDNDSFIAKRDKDSKVYSTIILKGEKYGIWRNWKTGFVYVSKDFEPSNPCVFAFDINDHNEHTIYTKARNSTWFQPVLNAYKMGCLFFESQKIKNDFTSIIGRCMI